MSRLTNHPIEIPDAAEVAISDSVVTVSSNDAELERKLPPGTKAEVTDDGVVVSKTDPDAGAMLGTAGSHIRNMIHGVTEGFKKTLTFSGVGYRANASANTLTLEMGYSHDVELDIPDGLSVETEDDSITVSGADKEAVGQFAATIRAVREPEPYKGAGIQYEDETIQRKEGKTAV